MKYLSIDIETTGLEPGKHQILEFAAVIADTNDNTPVHSLPNFHCLIVHNEIIGQLPALSMNAGLIADFVDRKKDYLYVTPGYAMHTFMAWLSTENIEKRTACAGKNFAAFDRQFLKVMPDWNDRFFLHRTLDPLMYYWHEDTDLEPPDSKVCCQRAGLVDVKHRALDDARMVIELIRRGPLYLYNRIGNKYGFLPQAMPDTPQRPAYGTS